MTAILTSNNLAARDNRAPAPAVHEDGSSYPYRMFFDNNQRIVDADTLAELLGVLIQDYPLLDEQMQRTVRIDLAKFVQVLARSTIANGLTEAQTKELRDWEWEVLTFGSAEQSDPYGWGDGTGTLGSVDSDNPDIWSSDVPLVLIESSYRPNTNIPAPISSEGDYVEVKNIIWLRPEDEYGFLQSLSRIGYITFGSPRATEVGEQPEPLAGSED